MSQLPGMPGSQVQNDSDTTREFADVWRAIRELAAQNLLTTAGITVQPDGIIVGGSETVNGPLNVNGPMNVTGTLNLPAGIIGNDALTDPTVLATSGLSQNNFSTSVGGDVFAQASVPVPAGYTRATITCLVVAGALNSTGATDYLYAASCINGVNGGETPQIAGASGGYASAAANGIRSLTGLSGGSITVGCYVRTGAAWAANTANFANMNAFIYFQR